MKIVGVDCATVDAKVGLALGTLEEGCLEIRDATLCTRERLAASTITQWLERSRSAALIAMDAPLAGRNLWPSP
jgi:predicted RNase H-like nuclease